MRIIHNEPWHLPHMSHAPNDEQAARNEAARIEGARMGGGDMAPSEPMPLARSRFDAPGEMAAEVVGWPLAIIAIVGIAAGFAALFRVFGG